MVFLAPHRYKASARRNGGTGPSLFERVGSFLGSLGSRATTTAKETFGRVGSFLGSLRDKIRGHQVKEGTFQGKPARIEIYPPGSAAAEARRAGLTSLGYAALPVHLRGRPDVRPAEAYLPVSHGSLAVSGLTAHLGAKRPGTQPPFPPLELGRQRPEKSPSPPQPHPREMRPKWTGSAERVGEELGMDPLGPTALPEETRSALRATEGAAEAAAKALWQRERAKEKASAAKDLAKERLRGVKLEQLREVAEERRALSRVDLARQEALAREALARRAPGVMFGRPLPGSVPAGVL